MTMTTANGIEHLDLYKGMADDDSNESAITPSSFECNRTHKPPMRLSGGSGSNDDNDIYGFKDDEGLQALEAVEAALKYDAYYDELSAEDFQQAMAACKSVSVVEEQQVTVANNTKMVQTEKKSSRLLSDEVVPMEVDEDESTSVMQKMTSNAQPELATSAMLDDDDDIKMGVDVHAAKFDTAVDDSTSLVTTQDSLEDQVTPTQSEGTQTETNSIVLSDRALHTKLSAEEPPPLVPRDVDGDDDDCNLKLDVDPMDLGKKDPHWKDTPWNEKNVHYKMLPRTSKGNISWFSQIFTLLYACYVMMFIWRLHPDCNVTLDRCVYHSKEQSRHEMNKSDAIIAFLLSIMDIPLDHLVRIVVTDANRIGVVLAYSMALAEILQFRPNLEFVCINQYGISVVTSLEITALNSDTLKEIGQTSTQMDSSKGIAVREDCIDKVEAIKEAALEWYHSLSIDDSEESELVKDAKSLGDALQAEIPESILDDLHKDFAEKVSQVESGEMTPSAAVEALKTSFLLKVPNRPKSLAQGDSIDLVFTRSSRSHSSSTKSGEPKTTHGVLTNQAARCFASKDYHDDDTKTPACVIQANRVNRDEVGNLRNKLAIVLVLVFHGVVDTLYLSTLVRLSSSASVIKIFLAAFDKFNVKCIANDCIGKDLVTVAEAEVDRLLKRSIAAQAKNDAEDAERDKMSPLDRLRSFMMKAIAACKFGHHVHFLQNARQLLRGTDDSDEDTKMPAKRRKKN